MSVLYLYPVTSVTTGQRIPDAGVHTEDIEISDIWLSLGPATGIYAFKYIIH